MNLQNAALTLVPMALCAVSCASLGVWLVLQRRSMVGDAMSHSVLPGLVVVFLAFGTRAPGPMLVGAALSALLAVALSHALTQWLHIPEDAGLGAVFTTLFAIGVLLISRFAQQVDLDPGCVLYGLPEFLPLDTVALGPVIVPRAMQVIGPLCGVVLSVLFLARRELLLAALDAPFAASVGRRPGLVQLGLMVLVAIAAVASFEVFGAVLVIALLIVPAATAQLLTTRLHAMFRWAVALAVSACVVGYLLAVATNTSVAGLTAAWAAVQYAGVAIMHSRRTARRRSAREPSPTAP